MKLIGAAFPRTGTMSVKNALEHLGLGPCYHMHELFLNPAHVPVWEDASRGRNPDWRCFLSEYSATLDSPACLFWKELAEAFPEAKILLLRRDPESWYDSMLATIYPVILREKATDPALQLVWQIFFERFLEGRFEDREFTTARFRRYCDDVIRAAPTGKLLVYDVADGWSPLCEFLSCEVPEVPFPRKNSRADFRARNELPSPKTVNVRR